MYDAERKSVAIIGAGPVGLAAAAHALEQGLRPIVLEAGPDVSDAVRQWGHVRMFSPWEYNIDRSAEHLLTAAGWTTPDPSAYPTGGELIERYLHPLAHRTILRDHIHMSAEVTAITRRGRDKVKSDGRAGIPFVVRYCYADGVQSIEADAVIDASGTWLSPNPAGADGVPAIGEDIAQAHIAYGMPDILGRDRTRYQGKRVAVLGAGHSAAGCLIDMVSLAETSPDTQTVWLLRGRSPDKAFGGGVNDKLVARGELGARLARLAGNGRLEVEAGFAVSDVQLSAERLRIGTGSSHSGRYVDVDELIVATGFRPDFSFAREIRLALDPALECPPQLAPLIDPNVHSCGTVRPHGARELAQPEPGFYIAGMKSYGRAPTFLMLTGYEQVRSIVADIVGDKEAAASVELVLPETGVCSRPVADGAATCCGGPAVTDLAACCAADEAAKAAGDTGCGWRRANTNFGRATRANDGRM